MKLSIKKSFTNGKFKNGAYSTILVVMVISVVIMANLFMGALDINVDLSSTNMYTLTKETETIVKGISDKITLYYLAEDGKEDSQIQKVVEKYGKLSTKIKVITKDPVLYPNFTSQYTQEEVTGNSVIVVNETTKNAKYIPNENMIVTEYDPQTYQPIPTGLDVEGQISSAIQYVTAEKLPKMYILKGHNEQELGQSLTSAITKLNVTTETLESLKISEIPKDCEILLINGPYYDFTKEEADMIKKYLQEGGKAIIFTTYTPEKLSNFSGILTDYGVNIQQGVIYEEAGNYVGNTPNLGVPSMADHEITKSIGQNGKWVIVPNGQGLSIVDKVRSSLSVTPIFTTSEGSFLRTDSTIESIVKEESDLEGPFHLGVAVTETKDKKETKLAVFGSAYITNEQMVSTGQFGNSDLVLNSISWMAKMETGLNIPKRSLEQTYLTVSPAEANFWGAFLILILPGVLIFSGLAIWMKRRKA